MPRKRWFHATTGEKLPAILEQGLQPRGIVGEGIQESYLVDPEVVYLWGTLDRAAAYGLQCQEMEIVEVRDVDPNHLAPCDEFSARYLQLDPHDLWYDQKLVGRYGKQISAALIDAFGSDRLSDLVRSDDDPSAAQGLNVVMQALRVLPPALRHKLALDCDSRGNPIEHFGPIAPQHLRAVSAAEVLDCIAEAYGQDEWRGNTDLLDQVTEIWRPRLLVGARIS